MRVGFVTPRYGPDVMGGAETAARNLAEHLVADLGVDVEVFSTCALDHLTWEDVLPPGDSELNGVIVHRYPAVAGRQDDFYGLDSRLRIAPELASRRQAERWVHLNGPLVPDLTSAVVASAIDVACFYPYLHSPVVTTIGRVPMPSVLHPAAHDEPALYLPVFRGTFASADAICFHTVAERDLVERVHGAADRPQIVLGLGAGPVVPPRRSGQAVLGIPPDRPYLVSLGRVDSHKGSVMLAEFFLAYKERHPGPLALAFVGPVSAEIPPHGDLITTGVVDEQDKWDILRGSLFSISPSALESFSLVVLEAWLADRPVVVNRACGPTSEHAARSGGGLAFASFPEFEAALDRLLASPDLRARLATAGRAYVTQHYDWPVLIRRYADFLHRVIDRGPSPVTAEWWLPNP